MQIYTHIDLHSLGNIITQSSKSAQVIMRQPVDWKKKQRRTDIVICVPQWTNKQSIYKKDSGY